MNFMLSRTMDVCLSPNEAILMPLNSRDNGVERADVVLNRGIWWRQHRCEVGVGAIDQPLIRLS